MKRIFVLGSINIDLVAKCQNFPSIGETRFMDEFIMESGGKGANQAVSAAKLGSEVYLIGALGNDSYASILRENLLKYQVNIDHVKTSNCSSGKAMIISTNYDNLILVDQAANKTISKDDVKKALTNAKKGDIFISQYEVNKDTLSFGFKLAKELGMTTILNPSPAEVIEDSLFEALDYLILNETEFEKIFKTTDFSDDNLLKITKNNSKTKIILTLGSKGSKLVDSQVKKIDAIHVDVLDTTAAGDTFTGAFASSISTGKSDYESIVFANLAASYTVQKNGAQQSMPYLKDLN